MSLRLDWVGHDAAKYACEHWHYSKCLPAGALNAVGVWEHGKYIGCVIFSHGAIYRIGSEYNLTQFEAIELTRIALTTHDNPVTKIIKISIKLLQKKNTALKLIVSYADYDQNHIGAIYQAGNWVYTGLKNAGSRGAFIINGKKTHPKTVHSKGCIQSLPEVRKHLDPNATEFFTKGKHKYLYPLTDDMRLKIEPLRKPYPKKSALVVHPVRTSGDQPEGGGSIPTPTHMRENKDTFPGKEIRLVQE
jgi:hypothetical protein